jgi:catechol 2,3-dioxygenase-like lactoylglutathione lyase family enzyme
MEATRDTRTDRPANDAAPDFLAHWVVKTARREEMIAWYGEVFGARVVHRDRQVTFLSWDHEHHRLALVAVPRVLRHLFPLARMRRKVLGIDHLAVQFASLERLLTTHERLARAGIHPVWAINHGPTTSLYYEDPDGVRLEFQVDNFPTVEATAACFDSAQFAANPIGVEFDPAYLLERLRRGDDPADLLRPGAGTRPGTTSRAGRRSITWRTL